MEESAIVAFVRHPTPGQVKTRLAKGVGDAAAALFYRHCAEGVVRQCGRWALIGAHCLYAVNCFVNCLPSASAAHPPAPACSVAGAACYIFVSSAAEEGAVRQWLDPVCPGLRYVPQIASPDLGARLDHALRHVLAVGHRRALVAGSDVPDLSAAVLRAALGALDHHDAAFGPAEDGGYYLIALRAAAVPAGLFAGVAWSTAAVLEQSAANAQAAGLAVAPLGSLPSLADIDTREDLEAWAAAARRRGGAAPPLLAVADRVLLHSGGSSRDQFHQGV
jgi:glycosyltransferase A (GT-A) superfamily protein (DUF2064 family)